ncbi:hypothetical protein [Spongiivirga citrea]|uniref:Uncharacterized protein n=1 Tax=Spongiivirga citrea TaxID=1481457 RepID=A0A6M0CRL1_9FLAO|nr:hypothetical protein [Spongiivirga citrea]NER18714.1 hypothetical protein [Spongiivirga citrea]
MNQLLILGSLVFCMNAPTDTTTTEIRYVDVETVSQVYNHETEKVETVLYIEQEEVLEFDFDTADYLPAVFDPYEEGEQLTVEEIDALFEEEIDLGFDPKTYLPKDFDPYQGLDSISDEAVDALFEEEIEIGFDISNYLPSDFNAYAGMETVK